MNRDVNTPSTTQGEHKVNKDLFYTKPAEDDDENEVDEFCPDEAVNVAQPGEFMPPEDNFHNPPEDGKNPEKKKKKKNRKKK